jgi:hypothetical protein
MRQRPHRAPIISAFLKIGHLKGGSHRADIVSIRPAFREMLIPHAPSPTGVGSDAAGGA